jgi:hypothetical protein
LPSRPGFARCRRVDGRFSSATVVDLPVEAVLE